MAVKTSEQLKTAFGAGEYPGSADYADLVDTLFDQTGGSVDLTGYATETYVTNAIAAVVDSAPDALNTLNELAAALGDDASFATTVTNALAGKSDIGHTHDTRYYTEGEIDNFLNLKLNLSGGTLSGSLILNGAPSSDNEAATKQYVDNIAAGIVARPQVLVATSSNLSATYDNGTLGVGATLTSTSNGAWPSDFGGSSSWELFSGILVKDQTNKAENGRYFLSDLGDETSPWVLTRCGYCDEANEIPGSYTFVQDGTFAGTGWVQTVADADTFAVGTDDINIYEFTAVPTFDGIEYITNLTSDAQAQIDTKASTGKAIAMAMVFG